MPEIVPSSIVSFSSEDKEYPASNLLKASGFNKWKCANPGEKNATVEFQLSQAERINQIDIGNEGSAFVEVLVRRTSAASDNFQVLLPSSSFMSPAEAKSRSGQNRVRIFKADRLARALVEEKWDRIRVVCSQPFMRNENYGLAFIRFHSVESDAEAAAAEATPAKQKTLAGFVLRDEAGEEDKKAAGLSLFSKKKEQSEEEVEDEEPAAGPSIATQIRSASKVAEKELAKTRDEKEKKEPPSKAAPVKKRSSEDSEGSDQPTAKKPKVKRADSSDSKSSSSTGPSTKKGANGKKAAAPAAAAPAFNALMRGVVFCMSGYENPLRSQLRDKAQAMGAQYRGAWGRECTHLICAFVDTPKYREVTGRGRIVRSKWIEECHRRRALLPWRDFRLGRAPSPPGSDSEKKARRRAVGRPSLPDSSEEEEEEEEEEVRPVRKARAAPKARQTIDISEEDDFSGASDSDSEAELRRRKQQRLRQKKKRKYGSDEESEEEWRPGKGDGKEETDSDPDAEVGNSAQDSDSDWAASKKKAEKKRKQKPKSPKKRRSFRKDEDDDSEEEILPTKNRATAPSNRSGSPPPPKQRKKSPAKSPEKPPEKPPAKSPTKAKSSLLDGSDSDSGGGWAPIRRKKGADDEASSSRTPSPKKTKEKMVGGKEKKAAKEEETAPSSPEAYSGDLPDLFPDTSFFFYGGLPEDTERLLRRVIVAYGGKVVPYMSESVKYVITSSQWDDNFDDALAENSSLLFVRPQWLFECDRRRKFVPYQKFQVVG